jgi:hypothetical protein
VRVTNGTVRLKMNAVTDTVNIRLGLITLLHKYMVNIPDKVLCMYQYRTQIINARQYTLDVEASALYRARLAWLVYCT